MGNESKTAVVEGRIVPFQNTFQVETQEGSERKVVVNFLHFSGDFPYEELIRLFGHREVRVTLKSERYSPVPYRIVKVEELQGPEYKASTRTGWQKLIPFK